MDSSGGWPTTKITLIGQIRNANDHAAWREFVNLYAPAVHDYCRRRGWQHADAQNITQDVFTRVCRAMSTFEYDDARGRFRSWLGLITHRQMLRYRDNHSRAERAPGDGLAETILETFDGEAASQWMEAVNAHIYACAMASVRREFDDDAWQVFQRVWERSERPGDVAQDVDKDPRWVYQLRHKIVARLRQEIERLVDDSPSFHRP